MRTRFSGPNQNSITGTGNLHFSVLSDCCPWRLTYCDLPVVLRRLDCASDEANFGGMRLCGFICPTSLSACSLPAHECERQIDGRQRRGLERLIVQMRRLDDLACV